MATPARFQNPVVKLAAYGLILAASLGVGAAVGAAFGPGSSSSDDDAPSHGGEHAQEWATDLEQPAGLAMSQDGYTLELHSAAIVDAQPAELRFVIEGPGGEPLTDYEVEHEKELHLVIVGRDLADYAHVHPTRDDDGTWRVTVPPLQPGSHRVYADFVPAGGNDLTLAVDLEVSGAHRPAPPRANSDMANVDGYDVRFDGELTAGTESELILTVTRGGQAVTDLQPYLGALGHLVAIREGDLAYLHVHPLGEVNGPGGPQVRFAVEVPSGGRYALFFDFAHGNLVHTASVIVEATAAGEHADDTESHGG